jgi:endonuclease/exonuclease/phosphatase family metal-dependent hydrolase
VFGFLQRFFLWGMLACLWALSSGVPSYAVEVRLGTFNVLFGVGTPGSDEYLAVRSILQRTNPDMIAFQELLDSDYENWVTLAADLGYPYFVYGSGSGPLTGSQRLGFFSRFPIRSSAELTEYPGATELTRYPLRMVVDVPGALNPFAVYDVHFKASSGSVNQFRRAIEARRLVSNLVAYIETNPLNTEFAVIGDFNEDVDNSQSASFSSLPTGLPASYALGSDVLFPVAYRLFPTDRFTVANLEPITPVQEDSTIDNTYETGGRLDYFLLSRDIRENPYGTPAGEVYNSMRDDGIGGLPKFGSPLPSTTSATASDHLMVFSDFHLIDALPCVNPVLMISEVCAHPTPGASFIELHNSGRSALAITNYTLVMYVNGAIPRSIPLSGSLPAGGSLVVAANTNAFQMAFGGSADVVSTNLLALDGNDVIALVNPANRITDTYGIIGEPAGSNDFTMIWAYPTSRVARAAGISDPLPDWTASEWLTGPPVSADPGDHIACAIASAYFEQLRTEPAAPLTNNPVVIRVGVVPNQIVSNLAVTAAWSMDGGPVQTVAMTATTNNQWTTPPIAVGARDGSVLSYSVTATFSGPSATPTTSTTNRYTYPQAPFVPSEAQPRLNEVEPDNTSTDNREFIELIAPAGFNLVGYRVAHYNGVATSDGVVWSYTLPSFVVPDDGVLDDRGEALGFCVISTNTGGPVANADLAGLPGALQNGPGDGLILYDPASNIVDAIAWEGAGDLAEDDPGTVVTNGNPEADHFLHVINLIDDNDLTLQAPNDVLGDTGSGWYRATATPGVLNMRQTSGVVRIRAVIAGDSDGDSFPDNIDNCPTNFNPIQTDLDLDGLGDACDPDDDGDLIPDGSDNCPTTANPDQSDLDGDLVGDACDPDRDGDGVENDEDLCPDLANPDQADLDNDGLGDVCDSDADGDGLANGFDNCAMVANPGQENLDGDSLGDACDPDRDGDGIDDLFDNCPVNFNPAQTDANTNGVGDACEQDTDTDGVPDGSDNCPLIPNPDQRDDDGDGVGNPCDPCTGLIMETNLVASGFSSVLPGGWSIITTGRSTVAWRFDDPVFRGNRTGGTGSFAIAESSLSSRNLNMDTQLRTPAFDLSNVTRAEVTFRTFFDYRTTRSNEVADVDISLNGATGPWSNLWRRTQDVSGTVILNLTAYTGVTNAMLRFHYYNAYQEFYWQIDDVVVSCSLCVPPPDRDNDGVGDPGDNCPEAPNPDQSDLDGDGVGDICDDDRDGDGLPDVWELRNFGSPAVADPDADTDGDGFTNFEEYLGGSQPTNQSSYLAVVAERQEPVWKLDVPASATDRVYTVLWKTNLFFGPDWQATDLTQTGNGSAITFVITNDEPLLFFRAGARMTANP